MQNLTQNGFTLKYLDMFQPTVSVEVRNGVVEGQCSRPSKARWTRLRLVTWLKRGWAL